MPLSFDELNHDEALRRHEFPVCAEKIFLAHAAVCPLPRRVSEAMQQYLATAMTGDQEEVVAGDVLGETRELAARLLGATREEIAFTGSTSMGLALVANGLDWQSGDNVVCYRDDYPSNVYPWMNLTERGVEARFVEPAVYGNVTVEDLASVVDARTRLVALASVHFVSGWRLEVDRIGQFLHERGILFCLDGIQSLGALETTVRHVDFLAADAHKWLLGPLGTAILYIRQEHLHRMRPALVGWHNVYCPDFVAQADLKLWPDARRFEPGSPNLAGIIGLQAALRLIHELGIHAIEKRVLDLTGHITNLAQVADFEVIGPTARHQCSGIVSISSQAVGIKLIIEPLMKANIIISLRRMRSGKYCLRLSPHYYNTVADVEFVFNRLNAIRGK